MQEKAEAAPFLSMNSVEVLYDNIMLAIKGVSIQVPTGEMIALLGSNGAGKSTTLKAISGLLKAERGRISRGEITFQGTDITEVLAQNRVEMGICHVIEGRRVFEHLSPEENLTAAAPRGMSRSVLNAEKEKIYDYFPRLAERRNSQAGYLSGGEQQMLAIGRALVTQPSLLMLGVWIVSTPTQCWQWFQWTWNLVFRSPITWLQIILVLSHLKSRSAVILIFSV